MRIDGVAATAVAAVFALAIVNVVLAICSVPSCGARAIKAVD